MGKPGSRNTSIVSVDVDEKGNAKFDAIVKQGANRNKIVQSSLADIKEKAGDESALQLPTQEEEELTAEKTRKALESLLHGKIALSKPTSVTQAKDSEPEFIRYTPNPNAPGLYGIFFLFFPNLFFPFQFFLQSFLSPCMRRIQCGSTATSDQDGRSSG